MCYFQIVWTKITIVKHGQEMVTAQAHTGNTWSLIAGRAVCVPSEHVKTHASQVVEEH